MNKPIKTSSAVIFTGLAGALGVLLDVLSVALVLNCDRVEDLEGPGKTRFYHLAVTL